MLLLWATLLFALLSAGSLYLATRRREDRSKYWVVASAFALAFGFSLGSMLQDGQLVLRSRALVQEVERLQTETVLLRNELERAHRANGEATSDTRGTGVQGTGLQRTELRASGNEGSSLETEVAATVTPIAVGSRAEAQQEPEDDREPSPSGNAAGEDETAVDTVDTAELADADEATSGSREGNDAEAETSTDDGVLDEVGSNDDPLAAAEVEEAGIVTPGSSAQDSAEEVLEPQPSQAESQTAPPTPQDADEQNAQPRAAANAPASPPSSTAPADTQSVDADDASAAEPNLGDSAADDASPPLEPATQPVSSQAQSPSDAQTSAPQPIVVSPEPRVQTTENAGTSMTEVMTTDAPATLEPPVSRPELSGAWVLRTETEETSYPAYQGLELTFELTLEDSGSGLTASGEKVSEQLPGAAERSYAPGSRTPITLEGEFLSNRLLQVSFSESGANRASSGEMLLRVVSPDRLEGSFSSDAGNAAGRVVLERR